MINLPDFDAETFIEYACNFIRNKVEISNSKGVVIGLSGGIDSCVVAALAVKALGRANVIGYILPSSTTSDQDLYDANLIKDELDIETHLLAIGDLHEHFLETCARDYLPTEHSELASANLKPRIRMAILYYYATIHQCLVIGTGNKTELSIGYFTKYGDGGVDLLPIGDLYKQDVKEVAKVLQIPQSIIDKDPTAGLFLGQTDEEEIGMSYKILDRLLYLRFEKGLNCEEVAQKLDIPFSEVKRISDMVSNSSHKRHLAPILSKDGSYDPLNNDLNKNP